MRHARLISGTLLALVLSACGQQPHNDSTFVGGEHSGSTDTLRSDSSPLPDGHDHAVAPTRSEPYDAQFIEGMVAHHNGAIQMAKQALEESERAEIKQLAEQIIVDQHKEIQQMSTWLDAWYPGSSISPDNGSAMVMGAMEISQDTSKPFDLRFLEAMISHHQGALDMAKDARSKAEHPELKQLAEQIIQAQSAEIEQMQAWQQQWFAD